jgi:4'-phosphopantetheinyl transferase superfamily
LNSLTTLRRGAYKLSIARIAALPYHHAYRTLTLEQRKRAAKFKNAKLKRHYLACKYLQQHLRRLAPKHYFSMSHTRDHVVIASAQRPIGIDAEASSEAIAHDLVKLMAANPAEAAWAAADTSAKSIRPMLLWLAKEACFKSAGNLQAHFDPQALPVRNALGWRANLRFDCVLSLRIAVWVKAISPQF